MTTKGVRKMSVIVAVFVIVGALIISFAIPPHHLFSKQRTVRQPSEDPIIPAGGEETR